MDKSRRGCKRPQFLTEQEDWNGYNRNSKEPSCGHPKGIIQKGMEAVRFPPGEDNRMRRRASIWGISSSPCGKARSPKSRRTGQAFRQISERR